MRRKLESNGNAEGVIWHLQRRLLVLLMLPLGLVVVVSVFFLYQSAGTAAVQQDQQLLRLVPLLADSVVVARGAAAATAVDRLVDDLDPQREAGLAMLMAPPVEEFLKAREGFAGYAILDANGVSDVALRRAQLTDKGLVATEIIRAGGIDIGEGVGDHPAEVAASDVRQDPRHDEDDDDRDEPVGGLCEESITVREVEHALTDPRRV